jgi:CarD family transcriptional regulator
VYSIGDLVSYPMHGAGVIEAIEERETQNGDSRRYYVLHFPIGDMKVMVPMDNIEGVGLRNVITMQEYALVIEKLSEEEDPCSDNWNKRYRENLDKMRSGCIFDTAEVVKNLTLRENRKGLSTGERKMLGNARQILLSEMMLVSEKDESELSDLIDSIICG